MGAIQNAERHTPHTTNPSSGAPTRVERVSSDKCLDVSILCDAEATPSSGVNTTTIGGSASSSNVVFIVTWKPIAAHEGRESRGRVRANDGADSEAGHVRNTSRVTSPVPFGNQKQNWRVRSLVSSLRAASSRVVRSSNGGDEKSEGGFNLRGAHLDSGQTATALSGSDTLENVPMEGSRAWKRAKALRPLAWAHKK